MAYSPMNFLTDNPQGYGPGDLLAGALEGYRAQRMPFQMRQEEEAKRLSNILTQAKAESERRFGGLGLLSGTAKEVASLEALKNALPGGENNPVYLKAREAFDRQQSHTDELIKSSEFYRTNPWRLYDPVSKTAHAAQQAQAGRTPEGTPTYSPEEASQVAGSLERNIIHQTNPGAIEQQALAGQQVEATFDAIDKKSLFQYSGPKGRAEFLKDKIMAGTGNPPERYQRYQEEVSKVHSLAPQLTNYWGTSVSPAIQDDLKYLVNPNSFINDPDTAMKKFDAVRDIFDRENKITQQSLKGPAGLGLQSIFGQQNTAKKASRPLKIGEVKIVTADGRIAHVPVDKASAFLDEYPGSQFMPTEGQ